MKLIRGVTQRSDPRVTPNIEILSLNSSELESNNMSRRYLTTRLEFRQHCVFTALKLTKFWEPQFLSLHKSKLIDEAMSTRFDEFNISSYIMRKWPTKFNLCSKLRKK